ncbi:MAG: cytochrome b, partial [Pararhodobacter sp.]
MPKRYHPALVALHWLIAVLLLMALSAGFLMLANTPNSDPGKLEALRIHAPMGVAIGVLMLLRLVIRARTSHPAPATTGITLADRLAPLTHWVLYALVLGMVASGIGLSLQSGLGDALFGTGALPESFHIYGPRAAHGLFATLLALVLALHVAAAIYHTVVRRDGL